MCHKTQLTNQSISYVYRLAESFNALHIFKSDPWDEFSVKEIRKNYTGLNSEFSFF